MNKVHEDLLDQRDNLEKVVKDIVGMSVEDNAYFRSEMILAKTVLDCAEAVLSCQASALREFKAKFQTSGGASAVSSRSGRRDEVLEKTPPTGTYLKLATMQALLELPSQVYSQVQSKDRPSSNSE